MNMKILFSALGLATLGACATATPYQAAVTSERGYSDQQIEQDRWLVNFSGNSLTDRQTVETYLLYRAAELTRQQGFDHFSVVRRATDEDSRLVPTNFGPSPYFSHFYCDYRFYGARGRRFGYNPWGPSWAGYGDPFWGNNGYDYREVVRYDASAEIVMGRGPKPSDPSYFNAEDVLINLGTQIQRPEA
tara:strand:+ start:162 stop:728 length:567 start_codon:yes stop_codon:yes gene_type:complete